MALMQYATDDDLVTFRNVKSTFISKNAGSCRPRIGYCNATRIVYILPLSFKSA